MSENERDPGVLVNPKTTMNCQNNMAFIEYSSWNGRKVCQTTRDKALPSGSDNH